MANPIVYGVWLHGKGWLKDEGGTKPFADEQREVADSAARLWGRGALVTPIDDALIELEKMLVARERKNWWVRVTDRFL